MENQIISATPAQKKLMDTLKIEYSEDINIREASELIESKIGKKSSKPKTIAYLPEFNAVRLGMCFKSVVAVSGLNVSNEYIEQQTKRLYYLHSKLEGELNPSNKRG